MILGRECAQNFQCWLETKTKPQQITFTWASYRTRVNTTLWTRKSLSSNWPRDGEDIFKMTSQNVCEVSLICPQSVLTCLCCQLQVITQIFKWQ
ncbi:Hypothetical predicted protein, partial [Paramuricea clavata]